MSELYTCIVLLAIFSIGILVCYVHLNDRIFHEEKRAILKTSVLIVCALIAEWLSVLLEGSPARYIFVHKLVKAIEHICPPMLFLSGVWIVGRSRTRKTLGYFIHINTFIQLASVWTGWAFYVDADNYYHHGSLYYSLYLFDAIAFIYVILAFVKFSREYRRKNNVILLLLCAYVIFFVAIHVVMPEVRLDYVGTAFAAIILYIYYDDFKKQKLDEMAVSDQLTGLFNRRAYAEELDRIDALEIEAKKNITGIMLDLNSLKQINDSLGHEAGDEIILGLAQIISKVYGSIGKCFRLGGDEFVVLVSIPKEATYNYSKRIRDEIAAWRGNRVESLSASIGEARLDEMKFEKSISEVMKIADERMYHDKELYYQSHDRRR